MDILKTTYKLHHMITGEGKFWTWLHTLLHN